MNHLNQASILRDIFLSSGGVLNSKLRCVSITPGIPTTIKTMGANITTIAYLRGFIIEIGSTIVLMVVEAQGYSSSHNQWEWRNGSLQD